MGKGSCDIGCVPCLPIWVFFDRQSSVLCCFLCCIRIPSHKLYFVPIWFFSRDFSTHCYPMTTKHNKKMALGERRSRESPWSFPRQTNKQTDEQTDKQKILSTQRFQLSTLAFLAQCSYRLSYRAVIIWLLLSDYYYEITIIRLTKNFAHTEVRTLDPRVFSTMFLPTEL